MPGIAPQIPATAFDLPAYQPIFAQLTSQSLGNAGDTSDGFEAAFNTAASALASQPAQSAALDKSLAELDGHTAALGQPSGPNLDAPLAAARSSTAGAFTAFASALAALNPLPGDAAHLPAAPTPPEISTGSLSASAAATSLPLQLASSLFLGGGAAPGTGTVGGLGSFLGGAGAVIGGFIAGAALPFVILNLMGVNLSGPSLEQIAEDRRIDAPVVKLWLQRYSGYLEGKGNLPDLQTFAKDYQSIENVLTAAHLQDYQPLVSQMHDLVVAAILAKGGH